MSKLPTARVQWQWCVGIPSGPALVLVGLNGADAPLNGSILSLGNNDRTTAVAVVRALNARRLELGRLPIIALFWDR
jgi:hypothetical protein